jgi:hypothetical protein
MKVFLTYFKPSGKYYTTGEYETNLPYMYEVFEEVRRMKRENKLPGLNGGSWSGPIYVIAPDHPNNYPGLIPVEVQ